MPKTKEEIKKIKIDENASIIRIVDNLFNYAIVQEAESILLEPEENGLDVSFSFYGSFHPVVNLAKKLELEVVSKIKNIAGLDDQEINLPQFGEFKIGLSSSRVVFFVCNPPTTKGEKIIIDINKEESRLFHLKELGFQKSAFGLVKKNLEKGNGGIIIIGDFDSGKTTTLYSFIDLISSPEINITTIEREISYDIPFINQSLLNIKAGFDHSFAIPSLLRQDPDVVMIDEISNRQTAEDFFLIAERGHLALASIYGENISTCLGFFKELGIPLSLFIGTANLVVSQKLVKRLCPYCVFEQKISQTIASKAKKSFDIASLIKKAKKKRNISAHVEKLEDMFFYKSKGCNRCNNTGFIGRIGVFEVLEISQKVGELINSGHVLKIRNEINNQGEFYLEEDAFLKAVNGVTSIDEALRIADR
jgi:type II secretory ATPase GspE/PulE/Tfp pilus assembly ATPase PilB-like protein